MSWRRVRGHEHHIETFARVWQAGRLGQAYLFVGPPGIGKRLFAFELARSLLCDAANRAAPLAACDACPACAQTEVGTHPDLLLLGRPEDRLEIPIDTARDLGRHFTLKSSSGRGRVALLDDADDLHDESANCLLKTLEEPPLGSLLVLVATRPDLLLPTIVSRCQIVRFRPPPRDVASTILREAGVADPIHADRLLRLAEGSPGRARDLANPALWDFRKRLLDALTANRADFIALAQDWTRFAESAGKEGTLQRRRAQLSLQLLVHLVRDLVAIRLGSDVVSVNADERRSLARLADRASTETWLTLLERCLDADRHLAQRVQLALALEALCDALAKILPAS
jgi:DNA polymerase-3 subunit delta'